MQIPSVVLGTGFANAHSPNNTLAIIGPSGVVVEKSLQKLNKPAAKPAARPKKACKTGMQQLPGAPKYSIVRAKKR